ncbi:Kinesin- motor protein [Massospora cicadina]|nr:Kinesin- motor protein [Massospora cicadina]
MEGDLNSQDGQLGYNAGIIPRTLQELFKRLGDDHNKYTVRLSMLELYNEEVGDLLSMGDSVPKLTLNIDATSKLQIQGMEEILIEDTASGIDLLRSGSAKRHTAATNCNQKSSRSHCIFTITVRIKEFNLEGQDLLKEGKLYLVDLAGSEDTKLSGAINQQAREAGLINQSLLSLGRVITNLVAREESNAPIHIPYRESKLTRILQDSLGGQTKTCIIATISPAKISLEETVSTLKYATKAMKITNMPVSNQKMTSSMQILDLKSEIASLRIKLQAAYDRNGIYLDKASHADLLYRAQQGQDRVIEMGQEMDALRLAIKREVEMHQATTQSLNRTKAQLDRVTQKLTLKATECREKTSQLLKAQHLLDEQKALKEAYCFTEAKLDAVASSLVQDMNSRIGDILKLHEKIERKTSVTERNKQTLKLLEETVANEVSHLHAKLEVFRLEQEALSKDLKGVMATLQTDFADANDRKSTELADKEASTLATLGALDLALENHLNESKACLDNLTSECEASQKAFVGHLADLCETLKLDLQGITEQSLSLKDELWAQKEALTSLVERLKSQLHTQLEEHRTSLQRLRDSLTSQDSDQVRVLREQVQSLQATISEYQQTEPAFIQRIMASLGEHLKAYSGLNNRLIGASQLAAQVMDNQAVRREQLMRDNSEAASNYQSGLVGLSQTQTQAVDSMLQQVEQTHAVINRFVDQSLVECQLSHDRIQAIQSTGTTCASDRLRLQVDLVANHQLKTNELHLLKNETIPSLNNSISTLHQEFKNHACIQAETIASHASGAIASVTSMEARVRPFVAQCAEIATACKDQTHETISSRLQVDVASGNTPKPNRRYNFPTEWERTDPEATRGLFRQACPEPASPTLDLSLESIPNERATRHDAHARSQASSCSSSRASSHTRSEIVKRGHSALGVPGLTIKPKSARTSEVCSPNRSSYT